MKKISLDEEYVIWCAGETFEKMMKRLSMNDVKLNIKYLIDNNGGLQGKTSYGYEIFSPDKLYSEKSEIKIIICSLSDEIIKDIPKQIESMNLKANWTTFIMQEIITPLIYQESGKVELYVNSIIVTTKCTQMCKHCSTMVPYIKNRENHTINEIKQWVENYFNVVDYVRLINIYGGEPLVHPELAAIIEYILQFKNRFEDLIMTTNATILPSKKVLELCSKYKILYQISDYGNMHENFLKVLEEYNIPYMVRNIDNWYELFNKHRKVNEIEAIDTYNKCYYSKYHPQLYKNIVFSCPIVKGLYASDRKEYFSENDYFKFSDNTKSNNDLKEEFIDFINGNFIKGYISACESCFGTNKEYVVPVAEQI